MTVAYFRRLYNHGRWADERILGLFEKSAPPEALKLQTHIISAQAIWLVRLTGGDPASLQPFPESDLAGLTRRSQENHQAWIRFLNGLTDDLIASSISYKNLKGDPFTTPVWEVLSHLMLHGHYHRGQVMRIMRQAGAQVAATDFIIYSREPA